MLGATATSEDAKATVTYPEVGSFVAAAFTDSEFNGVVVNITKLNQLLVRKGNNDLTNAFNKIYEAINGIVNELEDVKDVVKNNRGGLTATISIATPKADPETGITPAALLTSPSGPVGGTIPARLGVGYTPNSAFKGDINELVDSAKTITKDILEGTTE